MIVYGEIFYVLSFSPAYHAAAGQDFAYTYKAYFFNSLRTT